MVNNNGTKERMKHGAFRLPESLANWLDTQENKSDIVRQALTKYRNIVCPHCNGSGVKPESTQEPQQEVKPS